MSIQFADIRLDTPTAESLAARYGGITALLESSAADALPRAVAAWEEVRREVESWQALVEIRFHQDTGDAAAKATQAAADALKPVLAGHESAIKRRLLEHAERAGLERLAGAQAVRLWQADLATFDPAIADDLAEEARLCAAYTETIAAARLSVEGKTINLNGLAPWQQHADRAVRQAAERARWDFFAGAGARLDGLFDALVRLRHGMARKLGLADFTALGYLRLRRVDYGPEEVAAYRREIVRAVVPLVGALLEERRAAFGWERVMAWDEAVVDPLGNPAPAAADDALLAEAGELFAAVEPRLGALYRRMAEGGFLDLLNRPAKAGGGFCNGLPTHGMPFIFGSFAGTHKDVSLLTHEMGHAFQYWATMHSGAGRADGQEAPAEQPRGVTPAQGGAHNHGLWNMGPGFRRDDNEERRAMSDYLWPTAELAEVHSIGLEYLCHPEMERLFGAAAGRFRRLHLIDALAFLPYGAAIDHFQHLVYARPEATAAERHGMWREVERLYLPWKDWGDLAWPAKGGAWQAKLHVYRAPFYYIDYALAQCCALQLWAMGKTDRAGAMAAYLGLCERGGAVGFAESVRMAGVTSPFEAGALEAVEAAKDFLAADGRR